jgi:uncharacterized membrane protein YedE/YeeE
MRHLIALTSGLVFGLGLIASGMTDPAKVKGFLDIAGAWNPSLGLVMGGAIAVGMLAFAAARRRSVSWSGERIDLPTSTLIDSRLVVGGVVFGIGWGLGGFCPGPAVVAVGSALTSAAIFVAGMLLGFVVHDRWLVGLFASRARPVDASAATQT